LGLGLYRWRETARTPEERHYRSIVHSIASVKCVFNYGSDVDEAPVISDKTVLAAFRTKLLTYDAVLPLNYAFGAPRRAFEYFDGAGQELSLQMYGHTAVITFQGESYRAELATDPEQELILPLLGQR
jgi:hypothetical protein